MRIIYSILKVISIIISNEKARNRAYYERNMRIYEYRPKTLGTKIPR